MARKLAGKRIRTVETVEETPQEMVGETVEEMDPEAVEVLEGEDRVDEAIEELVSGDDREGIVKLFRWNETAKRYKGLPSMPCQGYSRDLVAETWGGGKYLMKVYKGKAFKGSKVFEIDEAVKPKPQAQQFENGGGARADIAPSWMAAVLDKIGDAVKVMAERKPDPPPAPPDPMAMIEKLATTMRALTPPPLPAPPPPPAPQSLKDQLETIKSVIEVGTSIVDARGDAGGGSGDAYMGAIAKLADPIVELVKTKAQQEQLQMAPRRPVLPAPAQPPSTGPVPPQPEPARQETHVNWLMEIQRWLPLIVKRQQKNVSAESTAYFVLDELSEPTLVALAEFLQRDDAEMALKQVLPAELNNNPAWLSEFLTAVRDYLFTDDEEDDDADQDAVPPTGPTKIIDLEAEAEKRLGKLKPKPQEAEGQGPEQPPA